MILFFSVAVLSACSKKGDPGPQGAKGDVGATGANGETGPGGPQGATGDSGVAGPKGDKGDAGDTGATGPQGEKGDTGATGEKGDKGDKGDQGDKGDKGDTGAAGQDGQDGNANVTSYVFENRSVSLTGYTVFNIPAITQNVVNTGLVLGFMRSTGSGNAWFTMPFQEDDRRTSLAYFTTGMVFVKSNYNSSGIDFRFVVVPGSSVSKLAGINTRNFEAVKAALRITE